MVDQALYRARRDELMALAGERCAIVIASAALQYRNADVHHVFRQHSDFYYLTGFAEPDAVMVLLPEREEGAFILFCRPRDPVQERWSGARLGLEGVIEDIGADQSFAITALDEQLPKLLQDVDTVYALEGLQPEMEASIQLASQHSDIVAEVPSQFVSIAPLLHNMRRQKEPHEQDSMRRAAQIAVQAHTLAMQRCRPGLYEYQLEATLSFVMQDSGARSHAYPPIVASGPNSCVLHYDENSRQMHEGDLVLIDAGAEYAYYASDITRTFPVSGRFTDDQRAVYEVVLHAHDQVIAAVKPGVSWVSLQELTVRLLTEGLCELGILEGDVDKLIKKKAYQPFYMHGFGHWLGMDVHDAGEYKEPNGESVALQPGMVLTVEPGLYFAADNDGLDPRWRNIGVRIEDDVLVTEQGCEVLTQGLPTSVQDIEALIQGGQ